MATTHSIAEQLTRLGGNNHFATRLTMEGDPGLTVQGVGHISLPVDTHTAHRLCAAARPASYGYKDQTRLDPKVRDTWEVSGNCLRFENPKWQEWFDKALQKISLDLGFASGEPLRAELHNLLIYGPGQFFATHQDSEKKDGMIGTLVITLPSKFSGGEFVVSHMGEKVTSRGTVRKLGLIAFFADCAHEVRPVKEGYRVVLTYNLIAPHGLHTPDIEADTLAALSRSLTAYWQQHERLVYLLDHEYTQASLSWKRLKGDDAIRVAALRNVADTLDAEIFLTLADVHEVWTTEFDVDDYRYDYFDDEEVVSWQRGRRGEPDPGELVDGSITLKHWVATDGSVQPVQNGHVDDAELCFTLASRDCTPFDSHYEGYTGNEGNTLERWYHRAAIVMWPRTRAFAVRAQASPSWAIEQIDAALENNHVEQAREWASSLLPWWARSVSRQQHAIHSDDPENGTNASDLLEGTLPVAAGLQHPDVAAALLAPFRLTDLTPHSGPWFIALLEHYGPDWCRQLLEHWQKPSYSENRYTKLQWMARVLPQLVQTLNQPEHFRHHTLTSTLLQNHWEWLKEHINQELSMDPVAFRHEGIDDTAQALFALFLATSTASQALLEHQIVDSLVSPRWPFPLALAVLHTAAEARSNGLSKAIQKIHKHCIQELTTRLQQPERAPDNWSIDPPDGCDDTLAAFLRHSKQQTLEWPLRKDRRLSIHRFIDHHQLPVSHETRHIGSPHTLVLKKTARLFQHEAAERSEWIAALDWLEKHCTDIAANEASEGS